MPLGISKINSISRRSSRSAKTITPVNQTKIRTTQSKIGSSSVYFDGNNDSITVGTMTTTEGSGAVTVEAWVRFDILPTNQTLGGGNYMLLMTISSTSYVLFQTNRVQIAHTGSYYGFPLNSNFTTNTWYHIAAVRETNNDWFAYVDGVKITGVVDGGDTNVNKSGNWWGSQNLTLGKFTDTRGSFQGYIDEFRISNIARYTDNFTPSTQPFNNDDNTVVLLHFEGADNSTTLTDDNA